MTGKRGRRKAKTKGKSPKIGETLDSVSTVFNEIAQHPPHTLFAVCNWSIVHPRRVLGTLSPRQVVHNISVARYISYMFKIYLYQQNSETYYAPSTLIMQQH